MNDVVRGMIEYIIICKKKHNFSCALLCVSKALDNQAAQFDRDMLLRGKDLSEAEFERLLKAHQQNQAELAHSFEKERDRQKKALRDKVQA